MSNPKEAGNHCVIVVADLFAKINAQRKLIKRPPIEERAMASRCTLRFNVDKQRGVNFNDEKILVAADEIPVLEKMVNELFGVYFENELGRLCIKPKTPSVKRARPIPPLQVAAPATVQPEKTGLMSKIKRLFGG
ncbi:MAG: hypothetical protein PVF82_13415 [Gammaproteobacteria bacterium]|jgi:hypothetical protein